MTNTISETKRLLTKRELAYLVRVLDKSGFYIWAGLAEEYYPHDTAERERVHYLWNTLPEDLKPKWWHFLKYERV